MLINYFKIIFPLPYFAPIAFSFFLCYNMLSKWRCKFERISEFLERS